METPLLALSENDRPSLSSGWIPAQDEEEESSMFSQFSRLIEKRAGPLQRLSQRMWDDDDDPVGPRHSRQPLYQTLVDNSEGSEDVMRTLRHQQQHRGMWWMVLTGTCSVLYLGCIWTAYQSSSTWLVTTASFALPILPEQTSLDWTLQSSNLADLLQAFSLFPTGLVLWVVSLIFPCLFMVLVPTVILREIDALPTPSTENCHTSVLNIVSYMRWALLSWYVVVLLSIVLSRLEVSWTDSSMYVHTDLEVPGSLAYGGGMGAALITLVVLRWPHDLLHYSTVRRKRKEQRQQQQQQSSRTGELIEEPWRLVDPPIIREQSQPVPAVASEPPVMTALEEGPILPTPAAEGQQPPPSTQTNAPTRRRTPSASSSFSLPRRTVLVFQLGLVSWVLWLPSMSIPILRWTYGGVVGESDNGDETKEDSSFHLTLWQLPHALWSTQRDAQTAIWIRLAFGLLLTMTVYIVPFATNLLGAGVWTLPRRYSCVSRAWLYAAQPASASLVLCLAILVAVPALPSFWNHVLLQNERIPPWWCPAGKCLPLHVHFQPGIWFLLVQSLVQEVFVMMTFRWS